MSGVSSNPGDQFGEFEVSETNIEKAENKASKKRGFQQFPMCLHKPEGLTKEVHDEDALAAALKVGWYADVRDVPVDGDGDGVPDVIHHMTVEQAAEALKGADAKQLAAFEAEEASHGARAEVLALIEAAKDAIPAKPKGKKK